MSNKPNLWPITGGKKSGPPGKVNMPQMNNSAEIRIDQCSSFHCPQCLASAFRDTVQLLEVSRLVTGTPTDQVMRVPTFQCVQCGHISMQTQLKRITPAEREEIISKMTADQEKQVNEVKEEEVAASSEQDDSGGPSGNATGPPEPGLIA